MPSGCCRWGFAFALEAPRFPRLVIISGVQAAVDHNAAPHRNDSDSDGGGGKENRTLRLQIDSAVFQFPRSALARPVKLSLGK